MIKIVHIQTGITPTGNIPFKLHETFLKYGYESSLSVFDSKTDPSPLIDVIAEYPRRFSAIINNYYNKIFIKKFLKPSAYLFSNPVTFGFDLSKHPKIIDADIIYLHWALGGFLSLRSILKLVRTGKPIFIYLHDMWPITGGCHHSLGCMNFEKDCNFCPLFIKEKQFTSASKQLKFKRKIAEDYSNIYFVATSSWMMDNAKKSQAVLNRKIFYIPHFIDSSIYKPLNKSIAKKLLNLPQSKKVIGFGSVNPLLNPFKGVKYLSEALFFLAKSYNKNDVVVLIFGSDRPAIEPEYPFDTFYAGRLNDHNSLAMLYNALDVFVTPSLGESFGMTTLESIACGTPVVCFDVGGAKDIIQHKINGYKAVYKDSNDLANGISYCLKNNMDISASKKFDEEYCMNLHKKNINEVLNS